MKDIKTTKNGDIGPRLHSFIASLSVQAKKNYTNFSQMKGKTKKVSKVVRGKKKLSKEKKPDQVFSILNHQTEYNENELLPLFSNDRALLSNELHTVEARLRASLVWFSKDRENELLTLYKVVKETMRFGGDYPGAFKLNKQVIDLARELDFPKTEIKAYKLGTKILEKLERFTDLGIYIPHFLEDIDEAKERANSLDTFEIGYALYHALFKQNYHARQEADEDHLKALTSHRVYSKFDRAITPKAQIYYWLLRYLCAMFVGEWEKCIEITHNILAIFEANKPIIQDMEEIYIEQICRLALVPANANPEIGFPYQNQLAEYQSDSKELTATAKAGLWKAKMAYAFSGHSDLDSIIDAVDDLESDLSMYQDHISTETLYILYHYTGRIFFERGEFENAKEWFGKIVELRKKDIRRDLQGLSRILYLLCLIELEADPEEVEQKSRPFKDWLTKQKKFFDFEERIYKLINEYPFPSLPSAKEQIFRQLVEDLKVIFERRYERKIQSYYFDFIKYGESKY